MSTTSPVGPARAAPPSPPQLSGAELQRANLAAIVGPQVPPGRQQAELTRHYQLGSPGAPRDMAALQTHLAAQLREHHGIDVGNPPNFQAAREQLMAALRQQMPDQAANFANAPLFELMAYANARRAPATPPPTTDTPPSAAPPRAPQAPAATQPPPQGGRPTPQAPGPRQLRIRPPQQAARTAQPRLLTSEQVLRGPQRTFAARLDRAIGQREGAVRDAFLRDMGARLTPQQLERASQSAREQIIAARAIAAGA